ncbi:hypothetical protein SAMN06298216_4376 [Spirosomataceae bacterium TFI 002]|nr:hypothetical protein SAMN06298216_4376 [Spirosomataceae bacterium TFI 002]
MIIEAFEAGLFLNEEEFIVYGWISDDYVNIKNLTYSQYQDLIIDKLKRLIENQFYREVYSEFDQEDICNKLFNNPDKTAYSLFQNQFDNADRKVKESLLDRWSVDTNTVNVMDDIEDKYFINQICDLDEFSSLFREFYDRIQAFQNDNLDEYYELNEFYVEEDSEPWYDREQITKLSNQVYDMGFVDFSFYVQEKI